MIKNLDTIKKQSPGTELLQNLSDEKKPKEVVSTISEPEVAENVPDKPVDTKEDQYNSMIRNGVEVVDVKAIEKKKQEIVVGNRYNFGIPIKKDEKKNFDKIG